MVQNLRYCGRQRTEALADKQWKFGCIYQVRFEHIIAPSTNKISYDSLDFMTLSDDLHTFHWFAGLQS